MHRLMLLVSIGCIVFCGCKDNTPSPTGSNVRTTPLGYTATLTQKDAKDLVSAGRDRDEIDGILKRILPSPEWAELIRELILDHNERFRKEAEAKNGTNGVKLEVWGLQRPEHFEDTGPVWFQSDIERALLPAEWHQRIERDRAANTIAVYWSISSR